MPNWAIIGAFLGPKGDPRRVAYLLVPLAAIEIIDDWQVLGLLGTGSKSLVLRDVFVREHRSVMVSDLFAGTPPGAVVHPDDPVLRPPRGFLSPIHCRRSRSRSAAAPLTSPVRRWRPGCRAG